MVLTSPARAFTYLCFRAHSSRMMVHVRAFLTSVTRVVCALWVFVREERAATSMDGGVLVSVACEKLVQDERK